jgi:hypothetical protein
MKQEKKNKRKVLPESQQKKVKKKIDPQQQQEQEQLLYQSDAISPANKKVNKVEVAELRNGDIINLDEYILEAYAEKSTHFFPSFYNLIADLLGVNRDVMKTFVKPAIVPLLKRAFIYGRLPFLVQQRLYEKNPYTGYCTRDQFNYQWLTKKADLDVRGFIKDFEEEGEKILVVGGGMLDFIRHYGKKFRLSFQLDMFEGK